MKMRLLFLLSILLLINCTNSKTDDSERGIKLNTYSVSGFAGEEHYIEILEKGDFSISSENPDIAMGWPVNDEEKIFIETSDVGSSNVYLIDRKRPERKSKITVESKFFSGKYTESIASDYLYAGTNNEAVTQAISDDLYQKAKERAGTKYEFNSTSKEFTIDFSETINGGQKYRGTYEWEKNKLILHYNSIIEEYGFSVMNKDTMLVGVDMTDYYKQLYPGVYISMVRAANYLITL